MMKPLKFLVFFFVFTSYNTKDNSYNNNFYQRITLLNQRNDAITIENAVDLHKNGNFSKKMPNQIIYELKDLQATWLHFKLGDLQNKKVFTIWNNFLDYSKLFVVLPNGEIIEKKEFSLIESGKFKGNTRKPTWYLTSDYSQSDVFVKIKDFNLTTNLNLFLLTETEHQKLLQKEDTTIFLQSFFLTILFVFIFLIFIARKEISLLWYSIYILFCLTEYLFHMGVHNQFGVLNFPVLQSTAQVFLPQQGIFFACLFFIQFYNYNEKTKWVKRMFKILTYYFGATVICFYLFYLFNKVLFPKEIIVYSGRFAALLILFLHIYLAIKKTIPYYLALAFNIPILSFFFFVFDRPNFDTSFNQILFADTLYYLATSLEICIVLFFIVKSLIKNEVIAARLKNENLKLMTNFNDSVFKAQETEKQKLLENVHDSFGGYLEALKLRLMMKQENNPNKIQEIIDSFYKEYRYLLNNLYSPKINTANLTNHLSDFISKQNELIGNKIHYEFKIDELNLSSSKCVHLYRIVSELITNSVKHAMATRIDVKIYKTTSNAIKIEVIDDGLGFSRHQTNNNSYGLMSIKNRIESMEGSLKIDSNKENGTAIFILISDDA